MDDRPIPLKTSMPTSVGVWPLSHSGRERLVLVVLSVLIAISWIPRMEGPLDLRWDGGTYYVLGTALAEGKGYRLLNEPGEIEAVQYPPMLAAIVAAHQLVLGTSDPITVGKFLRFSFFLIYTAYIFAAYYLLRKFLPFTWALIGTLVCFLNVFTNFLSDLLYAEIPFGLACLLFVFFATNNRHRYYSALAGIFATIAFLLRSSGIALFAAWVGESFFRREFKKGAARLLVSLLPIIGWHAYIASVEGRNSYAHPAYIYQRADYMFYNTSYARNVSLKEPFTPELGKATKRDWVRRFFDNLILMPISLGEAVSAKKEYWSHWAERTPLIKRLPNVVITYFGPILLGSLVLAGMVIQIARGQLLIPFYILAYMGAVCLTPWPAQWTRYWAPMLPFLTLALLTCLIALRQRMGTFLSEPYRHLNTLLPGGVLALPLTIEILTLINLYTERHPEALYRAANGQTVHYRMFYYDQGHRELDEALDWLGARANPSDILASSMPHWAYLRTGRKTVMPPFERDPTKTQELLDSVPVRYIVVDKTGTDFTRGYTLPLLRNAPQHWSLIYSSTDGELQIYERINREVGGLGIVDPPRRSEG
jgi:hypothetical protein